MAFGNHHRNVCKVKPTVDAGAWIMGLYLPEMTWINQTKLQIRHWPSCCMTGWYVRKVSSWPAAQTNKNNIIRGPVVVLLTPHPFSTFGLDFCHSSGNAERSNLHTNTCMHIRLQPSQHPRTHVHVCMKHPQAHTDFKQNWKKIKKK